MDNVKYTNRPVSWRVKAMKSEFISLRDQGFSIGEIADIFDLHDSTVYRHLGDIAAATGVSRDSLLYYPQTAHTQPIARVLATPSELIPAQILLSQIDQLKAEAYAMLQTATYLTELD